MSGSSSSYNYVKSVINLNQNFNTEIINSAKASVNQEQIFDLEDIKGPINISHNVQTQDALASVSALFNNDLTVLAHQSLTMALAQTAKSTTSGLQVGSNASDAKNLSDNTINTTIDVITKIANTCFSDANQSQKIKIIHSDSSVNITDNSFSQIAQSLNKCVATTVTNSSAVQDVQYKLDQTATATTKGIDLAFLAAIVVAFIVVGLPMLNKFKNTIVFLIMMAIGAALCALYYVKVTRAAFLTPYSSLINVSCKGIPSGTVSYEYQTAGAAAEYCKSSSQFVAFDFQTYEVDAKGLLTNIYTKPKTILYETIPDYCINEIKTVDKLKIVFKQTYEQQNFNPPPPSGDIDWPTPPKPTIWLNTATGEWFVLDIKYNAWISTGNFVTSFSSSKKTGKVSWENFVHDPDVEYLVAPNSWDDPVTFYIYEPKTPDVKRPIAGPGMLVFLPPEPNTSGHITSKRNILFLALGVALVSVGMLGLLLTSIFEVKKGDTKKTTIIGDTNKSKTIGATKPQLSKKK